MKNKKEVMELSLGIIVIIILVMANLILGFVIVQHIVSKPEFKITKETCENETYLNYSYNQEIHRKIEIIEYYHQNVGCNYIKEMNLSKICYNNTLCAEYEKIIKSLLDSMPVPKNITKEVCKLIKIDEIIDCSDIIPIRLNNKTEIAKYCVPIKKQDLTVEWLDENCERICIPPEKIEGVWMNVDCHNYNYKCEFKDTYFVEMLNYFVEVLK